jgi:peptide methionine sulfoxide reductase MsrA
MKHRPQHEIAELVLTLKRNLDEAEQFEVYIDNLIRHCDKEYLLRLLYELCDPVEDNIEKFESGRIYESNIMDDPEELKQIIKEIRKEY